MARRRQPRPVRRLDDASSVVRAASNLLSEVADLVRQLLHIVGWLVLMLGVIRLMIYPHPSPEHLLAPGLAVLAVAQSAIRPGKRGRDIAGMGSADELPVLWSVRRAHSEDRPDTS